MQGLTESRFHMWRVIIALAYEADVLTPKKQQELRDIFSDIPFSVIQKEQLEIDIATPQSFDNFLSKVTAVQDRRDCIRYAKEIFWSDGLLGGYEQELLQKLEHDVTHNFNILDIMKGVRHNIDPESFNLPPKDK